MAFARTTAINKLLALKKRRKIVQGGTWGGKTYGIVAIIINYMIVNDGRVFTIIAETIPALKAGALKDFKEIMQETLRWREESFNKTERIYTFDNGSILQFNSFDSVGKAQAAGKRTDIFINEAYYIPFEIADALLMRTSGNQWIDFNPTAEFWAHTEIMPKSDAEFIILRYQDNEEVPETIKTDLKEKLAKAFHDPNKSHTEPTNIKSDYWANWCRIYIDGEIGTLQGAVYNNWKIVDKIPGQAKLLGMGMDFGYTSDPTTLVSLWECDGQRYYDERIYQKEMSNSDIAKRCRLVNPANEIIYADSAEPKSIAEIKNYGVNITAVEKGADSINFGIGIMQDKPFFVTARSLNMIKELRHYKWQKDKQGVQLNVPIDAYNHCMDAARYVSMMKLKGNRRPGILWQ